MNVTSLADTVATAVTSWPSSSTTIDPDWIPLDGLGSTRVARSVGDAVARLAASAGVSVTTGALVSMNTVRSAGALTCPARSRIRTSRTDCPSDKLDAGVNVAVAAPAVNVTGAPPRVAGSDPTSTPEPEPSE